MTPNAPSPTTDTTNPTFTTAAALARLRDAFDPWFEEGESARVAAFNIMGLLREIDAQLGPWAQVKEQARSCLERIVRREGAFSHDGYVANYREGGATTSYPRASVDAFIDDIREKHPELAARLEALRETKPRAGSLVFQREPEQKQPQKNASMKGSAE
jgi:hypothetical protein